MLSFRHDCDPRHRFGAARVQFFGLGILEVDSPHVSAALDHTYLLAKLREAVKNKRRTFQSDPLARKSFGLSRDRKLGL